MYGCSEYHLGHPKAKAYCTFVDRAQIAYDSLAWRGLALRQAAFRDHPLEQESLHEFVCHLCVVLRRLAAIVSDAMRLQLAGMNCRSWFQSFESVNGDREILFFGNTGVLVLNHPLLRQAQHRAVEPGIENISAR
jgi:hypothetical protein